MTENEDKGEGKDSRYVASWVRMYALVFEFLAALGAFGYIGHRLDQRYGWQSWGLLGGLLLGMVLGLYLMIREGRQQDR